MQVRADQIAKIKGNELEFMSAGLHFPNLVRELTLILKQNPNITTFSYGGRVGALHLGDILRLLEENPGIKTLKLNDNHLGDEGTRFLCTRLIQERDKIKITSLNLGHNFIGQKGAECLGDLVANTDIKSLTLDSNDSLGAAGAQAIAEGINSNPVLTELSIGCCGLGDEGAKAIATIPCLEILNLCNNGIQLEGISVIAASMKGIKILTLNNNEKLGDEGAKILAEGLPGLVCLSMNKTGLTSAGVEAIATNLPNLNFFSMKDNQIDDDAVYSLLANCISLHNVNLDDNLLGPEGKKALEVLQDETDLRVRFNCARSGGKATSVFSLHYLTLLGVQKVFDEELAEAENKAENAEFLSGSYSGSESEEDDMEERHAQVMEQLEELLPPDYHKVSK